MLARLRDGHLDELVGAIECEELEYKKSPYQLERNDHKLELAKDVSALANVSGGLILIGVGTEIHDSGAAEVASEIRPLPVERVDAKQILDVLQEWLYPPLVDVRVTWYQSASDKTRGVVAIQVAPVSQEHRPVLVAKILTDSGAARGNVLGMFERRRDGATHWNVARIHAALRAGINQNSLLERLDALQNSIFANQSASSLSFPQIAPRERAIAPVVIEAPSSPNEPFFYGASSRLLLTNIADVGLTNGPAYVLDAEPVSPVVARNFFASRQSPFARLVEDPPQVRDGGFGVDAGLNARMHGGMSWRSTYEEGHRLLEVAKDGRTRFAAPADDSFLCWGNKSPDRPLINPITLIESLFLYLELVRRLQGLLEPTNVGYKVTLRLQGLKGENYVTCLPPGPVGSFWRARSGIHEARDTYFSSTHTWVHGEINSAVFGYECLTSIYEWFGFTHDRIPYVREVDGNRGIDIEQIRNAKG